MMAMPNEAFRDDLHGAGVSACPNCGTQMPGDMRFCRACGCRLGEGVEEYTETVPLKGAPNTGRAGKKRTARDAATQTSRVSAADFSGIRPAAAGLSAKSLTAGLSRGKLGRACSRVPRWMIWVFVPIILIGMMGGLFSNKVTLRKRGAATSSMPRSYIGGEFDDGNGGVLVEYVSPPGSAADKAGLLGGDIIISFDGKPVRTENDLSNMLGSTPPGKTVEVAYIRDGQGKTTKLTTVSEKENDGFKAAFGDKPKGFLGVDMDEVRTVQVEGANINGVALEEVFKNRPGYIAGLRSGDIVIEFDGVPIRTAGELNMRIDRAVPDSTINIVVIRGTERMVIPVKMGED